MHGSHPLAARQSVTPADLVDEPLVLLDYAYNSDYLLSIFNGIDKPPNIRHRVHNPELVRGLVAAGKGYAILNLRPAPDLTNDGSPVKCLPIMGNTRPASIVLASVQRATPSGRTTALIHACSDVMQKFNPEQCRWVA
jgi:DNA-binding transcriptional LysR family regulator